MDGSLVPQATLNILSLSRYFSAASFAFAVWEHAITFDLEVQLIWKLSRPSTKCAFLINRYGLILGILHSLCVTLALPRRYMNDAFCRSSTATDLLCIMLSTFCSNIYLIIRLHRLWGNRRSILYILISAMVVTHGISFCLTIVTIKKLFSHITYDSTTGACRLSFKAPVLEAAWALIVAFDVVMVGAITMNALDRPRRHNRELLGYLKSDSAVFFAGLLLMRVAALVLISAIPPPNSLVYSCYIAWPLTCAAMSRFVLESETFTYQTSSRADYLTYEMESRRWKARIIEK